MPRDSKKKKRPIPAEKEKPLYSLRRDTNGRYIDHACYCLEKGNWSLLYTTPGTSDEWKKLKFDMKA